MSLTRPLQNSNSFFMASRSVLRITQTLDATCNVALPTCSKLMNAFAIQLKQDGNCGQDLKNQNPVVVEAYDGLVGYEALYRAGCLKDSDGDYCKLFFSFSVKKTPLCIHPWLTGTASTGFADAITNTSSPSDSYIYYLPLGISLPGGARPTCSECLNRTMAIFATAASNASQPISTNYVRAAQQIDLGCGPTFVNATIPPAKSEAVGAVAGIYSSVVSIVAVMSVLLLI